MNSLYTTLAHAAQCAGPARAPALERWPVELPIGKKPGGPERVRYLMPS